VTVTAARAVLAAACACVALATPASAATVTLPSVRFDGAVAGDLAGTSVARAGDVNGDGAGDLIVGAPGANQGAGAAYVVLGPFEPGSTIDLATIAGRGFVIRGAAGEQAGMSVAGTGDVNGDGLSDVVVGAPGAYPGQEGPMQRPGRAYVVFGSRTPHDVDLAALGSDGIALTGESHYFPDAFGWQVTGLGDVDGDGLADVGVTAPGNGGFEDQFTHGRAYVIYGRRTAGALAMSAPGRGAFRIGFGTPGEVTEVAAAGDWNRDGHPDVAVADGSGFRGAGAIWIVYGGRRRGTVNIAHLGRAGALIRGNPAVHYRFQGGGMAGGDDVDGDRRPDLVIGEPRAHVSHVVRSSGGAWIVRGSVSRARIDLRRPSRRAWEIVRGAPDDAAGTAVALGRVNDDRRMDSVLLAGGSLAVIYGSASRAATTLTGLPANRGFVVDGHVEPLPDPALGYPGAGGFTTVGVAGDLNGEGRDDLLAGARWAGHEDRSRAGAAYVFFSPSPSSRSTSAR
jgi:FG-GAP repeat